MENQLKEDTKSLTLRDIRQREWAQEWLKTKFGIIYICPRAGKIKTSLIAISLLGIAKPRVLIIYPIETIKTSWVQDLEKWGYVNPDITYTTTASLWKLSEKPELYDVIVVDEIHSLSEANLKELRILIDFGNKQVLGLSGTISEKTRIEIFDALSLPIVAYYPIEQAIKEKVITDYEITVILLDLDNKEKYIKPFKSSNYFVTEKKRYDDLSKLISQKIMDMEDPGMLALQRMHVLKRSISKFEMIKRLLEKFKDERILVFTGLTEIADKLGIPVYHSKSKDEKYKQDFCSGKGNHLATVNMFEAGVTIKPINRAIIGSFDSNPENLSQRISRLTGFEYDNPDKIAKIYILSTETVERKWLDKALEFFDKSKVKYVRIV